MAVEPLEAPKSTAARPAAGALALTPLAVAAAAVAALLVLVADRSAEPVAATLAGAVVLAVAAGLALWLRAGSRSQPDSRVQRSAASNAAPSAASGVSSAVLEALEDPVLVVSADEPRAHTAARRLIYANDAARELFRITRETRPFVTAVRDPKILAVVDAALFDGVAGEAAYAAGGVQDRTWNAKARPLDGGDGRRLALLTLRDDTELRRSERTRADFLANASHELRTPLASLAGFIETLRGHAREDPAARDRFLGIMHDQAARMSRLIDDLMSLSRIELNEHIPPQGCVDLTLALRDVVDALGPMADGKQVRIDMRAPDSPVTAKPADRDQILQVIQNLVENALKYTPGGAPVVVEVFDDVSVAEAMRPRQIGAQHFTLLAPDHAADQRYAMLRVVDVGPGIAREHLPRLTERFYRVEGQKASERPGTGLGLAIVKHIVNRHRGGLAVESAPGVGTAFCAYLPTSPESAAPPVEALMTERGGSFD